MLYVGNLVSLNLQIKVEYNFFKGCHPVVLLIIEIKSKSIQTKLNSIHYTELHVSTYLGHLQFNNFCLKHVAEGIILTF